MKEKEVDKKVYLHITAGRGPAECTWVVAQFVKYIHQQADQKGFDVTTINREQGTQNGTLKSALLSLEGKSAKKFCEEIEGSILWIGKSPYRKFHKRKNWFVGVQQVFPTQLNEWNEKDISFETMRASGAGGQHVNKTETAVRVMHLPTKVSAISQDSRSQHQNKKLALERLKVLLLAHEKEQLMNQNTQQWEQHLSLERGNPVKIFEGRKFLEK